MSFTVCYLPTNLLSVGEPQGHVLGCSQFDFAISFIDFQYRDPCLSHTWCRIRVWTHSDTCPPNVRCLTLIMQPQSSDLAPLTLPAIKPLSWLLLHQISDFKTRVDLYSRLYISFPTFHKVRRGLSDLRKGPQKERSHPQTLKFPRLWQKWFNLHNQCCWLYSDHLISWWASESDYTQDMQMMWGWRHTHTAVLVCVSSRERIGGYWAFSLWRVR